MVVDEYYLCSVLILLCPGQCKFLTSTVLQVETKSGVTSDNQVMNYQLLVIKICTNWRAYKWHYVRSMYHELLWSMTQSQLIAIDNSDVNSPQNFLDEGSLPGRASSATDSENCCFHL